MEFDINKNNPLVKSLLPVIKLYEGYRQNFYICSKDKVTIYYGRNVEDNPFTSKEYKIIRRNIKEYGDTSATHLIIGEEILKHDIANTIYYAFNWIGEKNFKHLPEPAKEVITEMCFILGPIRLKKFTGLKTALLNKNYTLAAREVKYKKGTDLNSPLSQLYIDIKELRGEHLYTKMLSAKNN